MNMRNELAQWQKKQATGALNDRQERRMQFLQNQQQRQKMAQQAENVMRQHYNPQPQQPQTPAPQQNTWTQELQNEGPASNLAAMYNPQQEQSLTPFQQQVSQLQRGEYKINNPQSWPIHASNRPQNGLLGQFGGSGANIDPGYNIDPGMQYRPGSNPQLDAAFNVMTKKPQGVPGVVMNLKNSHPALRKYI